MKCGTILMHQFDSGGAAWQEGRLLLHRRDRGKHKRNDICQHPAHHRMPYESLIRFAFPPSRSSFSRSVAHSPTRGNRIVPGLIRRMDGSGLVDRPRLGAATAQPAAAATDGFDSKDGWHAYDAFSKSVSAASSAWSLAEFDAAAAASAPPPAPPAPSAPPGGYDPPSFSHRCDKT